MIKLTSALTLLTLTSLLASCGQPVAPSAPAAQSPVAQSPVAQSPASADITLGAMTPQAVASTTTLNTGQTRQFTVTIGGQPAQPGQLVWTTTNAAVASVTQSGLVTARAAGTATVRAAMASSLSSFIDFPIVVKATTTTPPPSSTPTGTFAARVLQLTNAARAQARSCGATSYAATSPLSYNAALEKAAQGHAADMAAKNYFSHTSQDGRTFSQRITAAGYVWTRIAENIAAGQTTPDSVVAGWLQSPGHCANIMNPALRELGVGYAQGGSYGHYWVQNFGTR